LSNQQLKQLYERVYTEGKEKFFMFSTDEISREVLSELQKHNGAADLYRFRIRGQSEA